MARALLDENLPVQLRPALPGHDIVHVNYLGWYGLTNGRLLDAAERSGFEVFVTADRSLRYQQNLIGRSIALVVLSTNRWSVVRRNLDLIDQTLARATPGFTQVVRLVES